MKNNFIFIFYFWISIPVVYGNSENVISDKNDSNLIENKNDTTIYKSNIIGGRSKKSIISVVKNNIPELTAAYNRRLKIRGEPYFGGKLYIKYAIDEFGKVIFCQVVKDSLGDSVLVNQCIFIVKTWQFDTINLPGNVTEVIYPFMFAPPEKPVEYKSEYHGNKGLSPVLIVFGAIVVFLFYALITQSK